MKFLTQNLCMVSGSIIDCSMNSLILSIDDGRSMGFDISEAYQANLLNGLQLDHRVSIAYVSSPLGRKGQYVAVDISDAKK